MEHIIETWQIHNRINLYLLENIGEEALADRSASKGRTVGEQFAHLHNVRLMWLKVAAPELLETLVKLEKDQVSKAILQQALQQSEAAISELFKRSAQTGKIKGFKPNATAFLGYLISH